ncbi:MAG: ATP-dependent helicase [Terriglobia bacterium]
MLELNPEQKHAVEHGEGPLLVVAGPGTGKTRVITQRIVRMLERDAFGTGGLPLRSENILALTFTEKAAQEMLRRLAEALPGLTTLPTISTFHAFCLHELRKCHVDRLLLDKTDVWIFLRRRLAALGLERYQKLAEPGAFLHDLNDFFSRCQDELIEPEDFEGFVRECEMRFNHRRSGPEENLEWEEVLKKKELARVFRNSRRLIEESGASSLGSLVSETVALWRQKPEVLEEARRRFQCILVDEFQDTNYGQIELLKLLVAPPSNITAVGDDDQAIYRFRGASHGAFQMFQQAFPGNRTIYLSQNYRSTQTILRAAGAVIAHNTRYGEKPPLASENDEGSPVYLLKACDPESEASWIAEEIERLRERGIALDGIAVLYRAHHYRDALVAELRRRNVPFAIRGLSILQVAVLRDVIAYLKLVHSPHESISLSRVLLDPRWEFPESVAQAIRQQAAKDRCSLWTVIERSRSPEIARGLERTGWKQLTGLLGGLHKLSGKIPISGLLDRLINQLGWRYLPGEPEERYLEAFRKFLTGWEEKSETRRLPEFVEYFHYFVEAGGKIEASETADGRNAVQMMTVHAAKGLEFPVVLVIGVSARRFPATERKPVIEFPQELRKGPPPPPAIHVQEERRLFFVALTRARQRLYVSSVSRSEKPHSAFIQELLSDPVIRARDIAQVEVPDSGLEQKRTAGRPEERAEKGAQAAAQTSLPERGMGSGQGNLFESAGKELGRNHDRLQEWTREAVVAEPKLRLSATSISDYRDCSLKYKFQYVLKIPTESQAALTFGNLMHSSARHYFELRRKSLPDFTELEKFYSDHWRDVGFEDEYQAETYRKAGIEQLRAFVERHNALPLNSARIQMEQGFRLELDGVILEGRIDQINLLDPMEKGEVELIDYKTGRPRTEKDAEKSLQLSVYALAAERALGLRPVRLTLYSFGNNQPVSTVRTPEQLEECLSEIRKVAAGIRQGRFAAKPGFICRWCDFVSLCPANQDQG